MRGWISPTTSMRSRPARRREPPPALRAPATITPDISVGDRCVHRAPQPYASRRTSGGSTRRLSGLDARPARQGPRPVLRPRASTRCRARRARHRREPRARERAATSTPTAAASPRSKAERRGAVCRNPFAGEMERHSLAGPAPGGQLARSGLTGLLRLGDARSTMGLRRRRHWSLRPPRAAAAARSPASTRLAPHDRPPPSPAAPFPRPRIARARLARFRGSARSTDGSSFHASPLRPSGPPQIVCQVRPSMLRPGGPARGAHPRRPRPPRRHRALRRAPRGLRARRVCATRLLLGNAGLAV